MFFLFFFNASWLQGVQESRRRPSDPGAEHWRCCRAVRARNRWGTSTNSLKQSDQSLSCRALQTGCRLVSRYHYFTGRTSEPLCLLTEEVAQCRHGGFVFFQTSAAGAGGALLVQHASETTCGSAVGEALGLYSQSCAPLKEHCTTNNPPEPFMFTRKQHI